MIIAKFICLIPVNKTITVDGSIHNLNDDACAVILPSLARFPTKQINKI